MNQKKKGSHYSSQQLEQANQVNPHQFLYAIMTTNAGNCNSDTVNELQNLVRTIIPDRLHIKEASELRKASTHRTTSGIKAIKAYAGDKNQRVLGIIESNPNSKPNRRNQK